MDSKIIDVMIQAVGQTVYMVFFSTLFASILGFILGIVVTVTSPKGLKTNKIIYNVLDLIINVLRSFPFIILIVFIIPLTRAIVGTPIGEAAAIVPLTIAAAPFVARIIESSLKEVDSGVIEAAKSFGASNTQIIFKVMLKEAVPSIISGLTLTIINIIGYSAMAGSVEGGGHIELGQQGDQHGRYQDHPVIGIIIVEKRHGNLRSHNLPAQ